MLSTPDEWLRPVGKVASGVIVRAVTSADLVAALDATLKKQQARLKAGTHTSTSPSYTLLMSIEWHHNNQRASSIWPSLEDVFDAFDADRSGSLQISELAGLVQKLMPAASAADLRFFQILLDSDTDGRVTYEELVACIKVGTDAFATSSTTFV
jgi:arginine/lysine/ornithine decarboxylase